jgi:hypothetical protein
MLKFFAKSVFWIRNALDPVSRIRDKHPGTATMVAGIGFQSAAKIGTLIIGEGCLLTRLSNNTVVNPGPFFQITIELETEQVEGDFLGKFCHKLYRTVPIDLFAVLRINGKKDCSLFLTAFQDIKQQGYGLPVPTTP